MSPLVEPNADDIRTFAAGIFCHASDGQIVSLRTFPEGDGNAKALSIQGVKINGAGLRELIDGAVTQARFAAHYKQSAVFCPPIAGFNNHHKADEASLTEGYAL